MRSQSQRITILFFFFNDTATTEIYTLSLHDALPIFTTRPSTRESISSPSIRSPRSSRISRLASSMSCTWPVSLDRKSTRLNSSHANISYAVFCLKKKKDQHDSLDDHTGRIQYLTSIQ